MNVSLALHPHHREWSHTQLIKHLHSRSASSSFSSPSSPFAQSPFLSSALLSPSPTVGSPSPSPESSSSESGSHAAWNEEDLPTLSSSPSSASTYPLDSSSWGSSSSPYRGPSSASSDPWMPGNQVLHSATSSLDVAVPVETASFADDVFMDPVIDFISDMIVHGNMDGRQCMEQEFLSFQATGNSIPVNKSGLLHSYSNGNHGSNFEFGKVALPDCALEAEEYRWINNVLVADPLAEGRFAGKAAAPSGTAFYDVNDVERHGSGLASLYSSSSCLGSNGASQSLLSDSGFSSRSWNDIAERSFNSPVLPALPVSNHEGFSPCIPFGPFDQHFTLSNSASFSDSLFAGQAQAAGGNLAMLSVESVETIKFTGELEVSRPSPVFNMGDAPLKNGVLADVSLCPTIASSEQPLSFVNNEYLKAETHAKMYGDSWPDTAALECIKKHSRKSIGKKNGKADPVDLRSLLVDCAQAVGANSLKKANEIVLELRQHACRDGTVAQRLAHYFTEALVARLAGTGAQQYTAMKANRPSAAETLKSMCLILKVCPYVKLAHFFANRNILNVAKGASRLHIIDYGISYGVQWPALISALAEREGGPPYLRITGIEFPQPGINPEARVAETGLRLAEYAKTYNVPFEYTPIARKWEDIEPADLNLREGEVVAVNCVQRLRHLMDETVVTANASPRRKVLSTIRSLNPDIVVIAISNAGYNAPFFVSRFREALYHYSSKFDIIDTTVDDAENPQRRLLESACLARDILNVVACEGHERVERPETYRQWQARFQRAGFEPLKLDQKFLKIVRDVIKLFYHKDFSVDDDSKWMLLGWKGRIMEGLSAWRPSTPGFVI